MGNLRQKYTDEEWEDILKNGTEKTEWLTIEEAAEKYNVFLSSKDEICESEPMEDKEIRQYPVPSEECFIVKENPITNLVKALKTDEDYYQGWKANIAMAFQDEFHSHEDGDIDINDLANAAAERFLNQLIS